MIGAERLKVRRVVGPASDDGRDVVEVLRSCAADRTRTARERPRSPIVVAAFTGLRQGELLALRWRHVSFADRIVHVRRNVPSGRFQEDTPKSHRIRSVPLSDQAVVALDQLSRREHFTGLDDLVFCNVVGGHLIDDVAGDGFYEALETAGLGLLREQDDPIVFHDLRHTFEDARDQARPGDRRPPLDGPR